MDVRRLLLPVVQRNRAKRAANAAYAAMQSSHADGAGGGRQDNWLERVEDVREYDVPYHQRVAIDTGRRVGKWYTVKEEGAKTIIDEMADRKAFADPRVYAFDIECCKQPLKFPDANSDPIMMISYMMDGRGFLIINREVRARAPAVLPAAALAARPRPRPPAPPPPLHPLSPPPLPSSGRLGGHRLVRVHAEARVPRPLHRLQRSRRASHPQEWCAVTCARLEHRGSGDIPGSLSLPRLTPPPPSSRARCAHLRELQPQVVVTYNGDNFDFPYIAKRCEVLGLDLKKETGFGATSDAQSTHFLSTCCTHIDAIHWVT